VKDLAESEECSNGASVEAKRGVHECVYLKCFYPHGDVEARRRGGAVLEAGKASDVVANLLSVDG